MVKKILLPFVLLVIYYGFVRPYVIRPVINKTIDDSLDRDLSDLIAAERLKFPIKVNDNVTATGIFVENRAVMCIESGISYRSMKHASKEIGISANFLSNTKF